MVFVLDRRKRPLMPCTEKRARLLLTRRRAVVHRHRPFTIRLKDRRVEESVLQPVVLKIDPGFQATGEALVREAVDPEGRSHHALLLCEIRHRGEAVRRRLQHRSAYRRRRRLANLRHRAHRSRNRRRPRGWLGPSLRSRVDNVLHWSERWARLAPLVRVELELARFDMQAMENPEIAGIAYQHGMLFGYEVREYLLEKCHRRCAYCGAAGVPLHVEHIIPQCRGGTNRVSNLTLSCRDCNDAKGTRTAAEFGHPEVQRQAQSSLRDAAAVNSTRWVLLQGLRAAGFEANLWTGGRTRWNRARFGLPKTHALDALCVGDVARVTGADQRVLAIMPYTMHVVSHTHFDREWYLTFQQFRLRLVDLIDHVLEIFAREPEFRYFNLDAQTIVLEDYLQIRPHARARLEKYIREGRLTVGPWYQLNDQFLTSGEATVRSLLVGHRIAESFGGCMKIGYLPDQFGNLSQMPQILRGFGIDNVIVGRGYQMVGDRKMEFCWEGADGSRVLGSLLAFWYNNAQRLPSDTEEAVKYIERLRDTMAPRSSSRHLLLMNGVDHLEAQPDVGRIIQAVNQELERRGIPDRLVHSTLTQYLDALRADLAARLENSGSVVGAGLVSAPPDTGAASPWMDLKQGELREDRGGACLAGTLSSRMYLKQANHHAQITLEQYTERLSAFARLQGAPYPYDQLHYAWKLLMQNHPHDSICGCSIDQVHREMMPRFQQVEQIGEELTSRALDALTGRDPTRGATADALDLVVFNTLNWTRTDPVITAIEFPLGIPTRGNPPRDDSKQLRGFRLTDPNGAEVPFAVTNIETTIRQVLNPHELNLDQWVQRFAVEFIAEDVPACGYKAYRIAPQGSMPSYRAQPIWSEGMHFPTAYLKDVGEVGDEYLHREPAQDRVYQTWFRDGELSYQVNPARSTEMNEYVWTIPTAATDHRLGRTDERVPCPIRTWMTRWAGVGRIEARITVDNRARDHRLRVHVRDDYLEDVKLAFAEGQYDAIVRPLEHPLLAEGALPFHPQQSWVAVTGSCDVGKSVVPTTLTISNRGLPEYEILPDGDGEAEVAITLLRCVGQLSARGDGPGILTPDAQCLGEHTFEYAISRTEGDWKQGQVWKQAHQFNVPLMAVQCRPDEARSANRSFITVEPAELVVTAIKRAEDRDTLILRFFNIIDEPVTGGRIAVPGAKRVRLVNLNEEPQEEWREGDTLAMEVGAKKIVTVEGAPPLK